MTGTYTITATSAGSGCAATGNTAVAVNTLTVSPTSSGAVCPGGTLSLSSGAGGTAPGVLYSWSGPSSFSASVSNPLVSNSATSLMAGTYSVTATSAGSGCTATGSITVTVNATIAPITGIFNICGSGTTMLADATSGGIWSSGTPAVATIGSVSGTVSGVTIGSSVITYSVAGSGCIATHSLAVNNITPITGTFIICSGSTTLANATTGGVWSSSNTGIAAIGSSSGMVTKVATGTTVITYLLPAGCTATQTITVNAAPEPIRSSSGSLGLCPGATITLSELGTGTWSSASTSFATIGSASGIVSAVLPGTSVITYALPGVGCNVTGIVTVNPAPAVITGATSLCATTTTNLSDATTGGRWTSSATSVAMIGSTAIVTGVAAGVTTISYTLLSGCAASEVITVNTNPSSPRTNAPICAGSTLTLFEVGGGTWTSSNTALATVGSSSGVVGGVSAGNPVISYTLSTGCFYALTTTINPLPVAISGSSTVGVGGTITLTDAVTGGAWSSSAAGIASVGSTTGIVRGISTGSATITYTMPCGFVTKSVAVSAGRADDTTTAIAIEPSVSNLHVLPNPNKGIFTIKGTLGVTDDQEVLIEITDMLGQGVYKNKVIAYGGEISQKVQLSNTIANGMYILSVHSSRGNDVFHIIIEQ